MHPTLSRLIRPFYDPQPFLDHFSVSQRAFRSASGQPYVGHVPGLRERVYFWRHTYPEETAPGSRSKINTRELRMVQCLVQHLVQHGVLQRSVTIITPYLGQCRALRSVMRFSALSDVKVSTVDLFQGDENDIVILSLVRTAKLTEFIRMRNRLIVSCSRARFAFVIVGNDTLL
uniref:NFX1-type zinc finger-containing protein 1 n=1 Tax=Lygus hesperus TaxID=30085 RepID=A0A0A9WCW4_LYGHE